MEFAASFFDSVLQFEAGKPLLEDDKNLNNTPSEDVFSLSVRWQSENVNNSPFKGRIPMAGFAGYQGWMLLLLDTVFPPAMDEYTVNGLVLLNYTVLIITTLC